MRGYYTARLSGERLRRCYEVASPRIRRYLEAEIDFVLGRLRPTDSVLELGCGYGRVAFRLAPAAARVLGIDTAEESLALARRTAAPDSRCEFLRMDAVALAFRDATFDAVVCVQNGICAFAVDRATLLRESLRVAREGGTVLFSTYSDRIWDERLSWFEAQAAAGLLGAVDRSLSRDGVVVCEGGFRSGRMTPDDFRALCRAEGVEPRITEVDESSVFCEIVRSGSR